MSDQSPKTNLFKERLRKSLRRDRQDTYSVEIKANENVYACGDKTENVYFIESGQVKIISLAPSGKECLLAIYGAGDVFGEISLDRSKESHLTATAMVESRLTKIPSSKFFLRLAKDSLLESFIGYLSERISFEQEVITSLVTVDSERRLGATLLRLGKTIGTRKGEIIRLNSRITHEELSIMVGTTRPWISKFMKRFERLDLIVIGPDRHISINKERLIAFVG